MEGLEDDVSALEAENDDLRAKIVLMDTELVELGSQYAYTDGMLRRVMECLKLQQGDMMSVSQLYHFRLRMADH